MEGAKHCLKHKAKTLLPKTGTLLPKTGVKKRPSL